MFQIGRQSCDCRTKRQAHAFDFDAPAWFQSWLGVCGTDHGRPTRAQLVGHARTCVLFVNRNRNSHAVRGRVYGCGRVSAETDDHLGLMPGEDVTYFGLLGLPFGWKLQRSLVGPARERHFFEVSSSKPACGTKSRSRPTAVPTTAISASGSSSRITCATASRGLTWPAVPPPARTICF